jgi:preprotein translocase subunit SecA
MFGFGKKKKTYFSCKVVMSRPALDTILAQGIAANNWLVITFFNETKNNLSKLLNNEALSENIIAADKINSGSMLQKIKTFLAQPGKIIVLGERHPLSAHENQVAEKLSENGVPLPILAFTSLDDALMQRFGGENIKSLMRKMGMKEDEMIEHSMIEKSIENAQEKVAKKTLTESRVNSGEEWFRMNLPG